MKKLFVAFFVIFNLLSQSSFVRASLISMALETKVSKEFFSYDLGTQIKMSIQEVSSVDYHLNLNWYKNFSANLPIEKYNYCEKIEFSYLNNILLYYSIYCCSDKIDIVKEFDEKLEHYSDKTFERDGYYIWKDEETYIIYDTERNIATIARNTIDFFNRAIHEIAHYSPFFKNGKFNSVYQKYTLDDFVFFGGVYDFFKPYIKKEFNNNGFTYLLTNFKYKFDIVLNEIFVCEDEVKDGGLFCYRTPKDNTPVYEADGDIEYVFYNDLLLFYNVFVKNYGKEFIADFHKRFGETLIETDELIFGVWENEKVRIVANSTDNQGAVITIYDKNRFEKICKYLEESGKKPFPKHSMAYTKSNF